MVFITVSTAIRDAFDESNGHLPERLHAHPSLLCGPPGFNLRDTGLSSRLFPRDTCVPPYYPRDSQHSPFFLLGQRSSVKEACNSFLRAYGWGVFGDDDLMNTDSRLPCRRGPIAHQHICGTFLSRFLEILQTSSSTRPTDMNITDAWLDFFRPDSKGTVHSVCASSFESFSGDS